MNTGELKTYLFEQNPTISRDAALLLNNLLDYMPKWVPEEQINEALTDLFKSCYGLTEEQLANVDKYPYNNPTKGQYTIITTVSGIYEKYFDNFLHKGVEIWYDHGELHDDFAELRTKEFWENMALAMLDVDLPELNVTPPPVHKAPQFYADADFKNWYFNTSITLLNWINEAMTLFSGYLVKVTLESLPNE